LTAWWSGRKYFADQGIWSWTGDFVENSPNEFFTFHNRAPPETIGDFGPAAVDLRARRPIANSENPAIGGPFWHYPG